MNNVSFAGNEMLKTLRDKYKPGTRVRLISMDDAYNFSLKEGDVGTVTMVDDAGTIHMSWDKGGSLGLIWGVDKFEIIGGNV